MRRLTLLLLIAGAATAWAADSASHDSAFRGKTPQLDVARLSDTRILVHPVIGLTGNTNLIWCDTLQVAWNEAIGLVGEPLHFDPIQAHDPNGRLREEIALLNQRSFTKADLPPGSYVALADLDRHHVEAEIRVALQQTFVGAASPNLIPPPRANPGPGDFLAYSYLFKNLRFKTPFTRLPHPLIFAGSKVRAFGFTPEARSPAAAYAQLHLCDYLSPDDFVIRLATADPRDELILAKIPAGQGLEPTIENVMTRVASPGHVPPGDIERMMIPCLDFNLISFFPELATFILKPTAQARIPAGGALSAVQSIRFQLNETGAVLESEAGATDAAAPQSPPISLIFDKPFLLLLHRAGAPHPYFAFWIANPRLLTAVK